MRRRTLNNMVAVPLTAFFIQIIFSCCMKNFFWLSEFTITRWGLNTLDFPFELFRRKYVCRSLWLSIWIFKWGKHHICQGEFCVHVFYFHFPLIPLYPSQNFFFFFLISSGCFWDWKRSFCWAANWAEMTSECSQVSDCYHVNIWKNEHIALVCSQPCFFIFNELFKKRMKQEKVKTESSTH